MGWPLRGAAEGFGLLNDCLLQKGHGNFKGSEKKMLFAS
jgi:hypothetical protein